jgi:ferrous iron transport protein B
VLLISAFFHNSQGLVLVSIYLIGILIAILVALAMKKIFFAKQDVPFVMELPPYRFPTLKNTSIHMWHKGVQYLRKMGTVILLASVIIWALGYFPRNIKYSSDFKEQMAVIKSDNNQTDSLKSEKLRKIGLLMQSEKQEKSYIGSLGHVIEPVIRPLGFDWKIGVSIITGLAAKEIVVSTMGVLYQADNGGGHVSDNLQTKLQEQTYSYGALKGKKVFTPVIAYGFMLFVLIYFPCIASIAAITKESNWKWAVFIMFYTTAIAWIVAFIAIHIGKLFF